MKRVESAVKLLKSKPLEEFYATKFHRT
jgi:hypothetical protein